VPLPGCSPYVSQRPVPRWYRHARARRTRSAFSYDNSFTNFEAYEHPTAMLIAGNCNRDDPRFQQARAAGAEVLAYLNPTSVYDSLPCRNKPGLYGHDRERVPLWPYPSYGERVSWKHTHMTDMRPGSAWSNHVVDFVEQLMRDGQFDGVFLDVVGARVWADTTQWERLAPGRARRIHARQHRPGSPHRSEAPRHRSGLYRGQQQSLGSRRRGRLRRREIRRRRGARAPGAQRLSPQVRRPPFGDLGHRRVLVIARSTEDARAWAHVPGVTNVTDERTYAHPGEPLVPFTAVTDRRRPRRLPPADRHP
jgi:hypothetical protein